MRVTFVWPTYPQFSGGVAALFDFATALVARGNEVHIVHGPLVPGRVGHVDEIEWYQFDPRLQHHIIDNLDDPAMPEADVIFGSAGWAPPVAGLPATLIQGYGILQLKHERAAFHAPGLKVCVARWLVDIGVRWGVPVDQMVHVPYGIDQELFQPPSADDDRSIDVAMLFSTHPTKGGTDGIRALETVRRSKPDLKVALFGIIKPDQGIPGWADYHLGLTRAELVEQIYRRVKVFVQPSLREGFGFTAVEAMACGAALVTTDNGGSRDYAISDETAAVVPAGDDAAMAAAVSEFLGDDRRRSWIAENGEKYVRRFRWERSGELLEKALKDYVANPESYLCPVDPVLAAPVSRPGDPLAYG